jgi:serine protease Do
MTRRFAAVTLGLTATVSFLVGLIVAGSVFPTPASSDPHALSTPVAGRRESVPTAAGTLVNFADVAERINPAVVNIDATAHANPDSFDPQRPPTRRRGDPFDNDDRDGDARHGAGSGFIIDDEGHILTNNHVVERAERITVKLSDGRSLRARIVGTDPDTDIALIKVDGAGSLPVAPLGNSDRLRVGDWVCAIGNPLAYEHTVTVGVVSFIGRKLFDSSLDRYIQTDAAINFGNSGGPLINSAGEVIGINSAISSRASNIGFAVPIDQANDVLPQLKAMGRVSRGYIGVALKDVDPDLQQSLNLRTSQGALVQDVTAGSPGERAGLKTYDLIVAVDDQPVESNDELIRAISARQPGTRANLRLLRDGHEMTMMIKLGERPVREQANESSDVTRPSSSPSGLVTTDTLGLTVNDLDETLMRRFGIAPGRQGVAITRVEPLSGAADAGIERGWLILEVNRQPVATVSDLDRVLRGSKQGDVLTLYLYASGLGQRTLRTIRLDPQ